MFTGTTDIDTATGAAMECAYKAMKHVGGKLCLFQHSLPSLGRGQLRNRDNQRLYDTPKESDLLLPAVDGDGFYARVAKDMSRVHIACDVFLFSPQFTDVATLSELCQRTAGQLFYYPGFTAAGLGTKFREELVHVLTRETGFEAVMRVRVTKGWKINQFHGNYLMRGTDLLALPNVTSDSTFFCECVIRRCPLPPPPPAPSLPSSPRVPRICFPVKTLRFRLHSPRTFRGDVGR